jgi:hypothetical protein
MHIYPNRNYLLDCNEKNIDLKDNIRGRNEGI